MIADLKPYPAYKPSGVEWLGEVPAHWEVRRLRNVARTWFSNTDKLSKDGEHPVRLCNYSDVYYNDCIHADMDFMAATATAEEIEKFRLHAGDVLITKDSESWNDIGVPALVESTDHDLVCGYHLALLRPLLERTGGRFLCRALLCRGVASQFFVKANGVTRFGLSQTAIRSVWLPFPPLPEQAAIARFLDHVDRRIARYIGAKQKLIALLEEYRQVVVSDAVTGRFDVRTGKPYPAYKSSGVEWLVEVPAHWEVARTKSVASILNGATPLTNDPSYWDGDILWLTPDDLGSIEGIRVKSSFRKITQAGYDSCGTSLAPRDSIVISTRAPIGHIGILDQPGCVNQGCRLLALGDGIDAGYIYFLLLSAREELQSLGAGTTFNELPRVRLGNFPLVVPPLPEQTAIARFLD